jgi:hypothetical protein
MVHSVFSAGLSILIVIYVLFFGNAGCILFFMKPGAPGWPENSRVAIDAVF